MHFWRTPSCDVTVGTPAPSWCISQVSDTPCSVCIPLRSALCLLLFQKCERCSSRVSLLTRATFSQSILGGSINRTRLFHFESWLKNRLLERKLGLMWRFSHEDPKIPETNKGPLISRSDGCIWIYNQRLHYFNCMNSLKKYTHNSPINIYNPSGTFYPSPRHPLSTRSAFTYLMRLRNNSNNKNNNKKKKKIGSWMCVGEAALPVWTRTAMAACFFLFFLTHSASLPRLAPPHRLD